MDRTQNRLADSTSPYLRQHADNPVDWWPWGPEAFAEARRRDVPVFISIGYSTCHWCHVMAAETFEDPEAAAVINELTVPIKVDREQHPDVDAYYMQATIALSRQGGWPMTVFADPDGRPFFADTYFPPEPRPEPQPGRPSFRQVLDAVHRTWTMERGKVDELTSKLNSALAASAHEHEGADGTSGASWQAQDATAELPTRIVQRMRASEQSTGGFTGAPKFPPAAALLGLVRWAERTTSREAAGQVLDIVSRTWRAILTGGLFDQVEGGFHRYCVDDTWTVPHFEKTLYDNALLLRALAAYTVRRPEDTTARRALELTRGFLGARLSDGDLFSSGLDADTIVDSTRVEGFTYTWTQDELGRFGLAGEGDVDGRRVLTARDSAEGGDGDTLTEEVRQALAAIRAERPQPLVDTKVVTAWNAMTSVALTESGDERGPATAEALWDYAVTCDEDGTVQQVLRCTGTPASPASLEDCAWLLLALTRAWERGVETTTMAARVSELIRYIQVTFSASVSAPDSGAEGVWFDAASQIAATGVRPRDPYDGATPAAVGVLAEALSYAGGIATAMDDADLRTVGGRWLAEARRILDAHAQVVEQHLVGAGGWLSALEVHLAGPVEATVQGASAEQIISLREELGTSALVLRTEDGARLMGQLPEEADGADSADGADGAVAAVKQVCRAGVCGVAEAL